MRTFTRLAILAVCLFALARSRLTKDEERTARWERETALGLYGAGRGIAGPGGGCATAVSAVGEPSPTADTAVAPEHG